VGFGLLGEKLGHSYSPLIYRYFGIQDYRLFEVPPAGVEAFLRGGGLTALNVTIPYKKTMLPFCDSLTPIARRLGNVNLLRFDEHGRIHGDNTDYAGFRGLLDCAGFSVRCKKVLVLGTGGAAQTVTAVLEEQGASCVIQITRSGQENYTNLDHHRNARLLVNATPVGMYPDVDASPVSLEQFPALEGVIDLVYNPLRTRLVLEAQTRGIPAVGGLFMLAAQGRAAAQVFLGRLIEEKESVGVYHALLREMENIAIVGMPGSGKSTVGKILAEEMGRPFVDLDDLITQTTGRSPEEIIKRDGEAAFRDIECRILCQSAKRCGIVLSTGGGTVLRQENQKALGMNSRVYWLRRPLEQLEIAGRPLSWNLSEMYLLRRPIYERVSNAVVDMGSSTHEAAQQIMEEFDEHTRA